MSDSNQQIPAQIFLQTSPADDGNNEESVDSLDLSILFDYLDMIRNRLWLFIAGPVIFLAAAFFHVHTATPIYQSTAQLQIQPAPMEIGGLRMMNDPVAGLRNLDQYINTEIELMKTPEVLNQAVAELHPDSDMTLAAGNPVRRLADNLKISRHDNTFLINITYHSPDAREAARIANFLGDLYVRRYQERKFEASGSGITRLREQLDNIAVARDEAFQDLTDFKKEHQMMDLDYERRLFSLRINALTKNLIDAEINERQAEEAVATIESWKKEGHIGAVVQIADNRFAEIFRLEQLRMQMKLPELLNRYSPTHSEVKTRQTIIDNLHNAVTNEIETSLVAMRLQRRRAAKQRELIEQKIFELKEKMMELDSLGSQFYRIKDTYEASENAYRRVIDRINYISIRFSKDELDASDFLRVARRAEPGSSPVRPARRRTLAAAGFLGIAAGIGVCILLGMIDASVKHKAEIDRCMKGMTILGSVPARPEDQSEMMAAEDIKSAQAEAFRSIRTSLTFCSAGRRERCFVVSSPGPKDGKTTVAFNLAVALARDGKKVLLMECDMRRPRFKKMSGDYFDNAEVKVKGVSQLLVGENKLQDAVIPFKPQSGLDIIPCGSVPPNPGELLGTERFGKLVREAKERYDYVIIDSPPLLHTADAEVISGHDIPLLFVVRLFKTTRHDLRLSYERIQTIQARCVGLVVNQEKLSSPRSSLF